MKKALIITILLVTFTQLNFAQILNTSLGYAISNDNSSNDLFQYDPYSEEWYRVGATGMTSIEAITIDPLSEKIYAVDGGIFGTINDNSALFNAIGSIGMANGVYGEIELNNIRGLSIDIINQIIYATHRVAGSGTGTNDLLFPIDISTGKVIPGTMLDLNGNLTDYVIIQEVYDSTLNDNVYDVEDIAYSSYTGQLFALQNRGGNGVITNIDPMTGNTLGIIWDLPIDYIEGLTFSFLGELFGTTGENSSLSGALLYFDLVNLETKTVNYIDPTGQSVSFGSLDFLPISINDLALEIALSNPPPSEQIYLGDIITYSITIHNQGQVINRNILVSNYVPEGLILNDQNWTSLPGANIAEFSITGPLITGKSTTIPITFKVDPNFLIEDTRTITNIAEITTSFNPEFEDINGDPVPLPDIDSNPDNVNDETNIIDDEINGGGPHLNEDEDDHDIALIDVRPASDSILFQTNYSELVKLELDNNAYIIKNEFAKIYDYSDCTDDTNLTDCNLVAGKDNLAANEALWVITHAAKYISMKYAVQIPTADIIVNSTKAGDINEAYFSPSKNIIIFGKGDGIERTSMTAPDVVAHEYFHFLQENLGDFFAPLMKEKESGALRESIADIFGEIMERDLYGENDWIFGKQVMTPESNIGGIRSLSNPKDNSMFRECPDTYLESPWVDIIPGCESNDKCGIHTNCGVQNHWFYILSASIGIEAATDIVFKNFMGNLVCTATYKDAAIGSIKAARELYSNYSTQQIKVIEAWEEVGISLECLDIDLNFLQWTLESTSFDVGVVSDEVEFDLVIDSAGQDISADGLNFTLLLDDDQVLTQENIIIYPPLRDDEVEIKIESNEVSFSINRKPVLNAQKQKGIIQKISSNTPILGGVLCIQVEDGGDTYCYSPIQLSGYTKTTSNQDIVFNPGKLYLGPCINKNDAAEGFDLIYTSLDISERTCYSLGTIKIEVLNNGNLTQGFEPFTYALYKDDSLEKTIIVEETAYKFDELDEGNYTIILTDKNTGKANIEFKIGFIAEIGGSVCCPENLTIPTGTIEGSFNAANTLSLEYGSLVTNAVFEICDE